VNYPRASTALLLIDPYNDFIAEGGKLWPRVREVAERLSLLPHLRELLTSARANGVRVFFVPHHRADPGDFEGWRFMNPTHAVVQQIRPFVRGTWGAEFHVDFQPQVGEVVVGEHWLHSGFANTDLDYQLRNHGIDHIILAGMRGNACIEATARYGVELGYHVTLVKDATAAFSHAEWAATMEVNAPSFAHAIVTTAEMLAELRQLAPADQGALSPRQSS
jgi:nicotinamidase-related amidase